MRKLAALLVATVTVAVAASAEARNTPCSGKKGGVVGCRGDKFLCKNGTLSASKRTCTRNEAESEREPSEPLKDENLIRFQ